ncbi:diacylglycerol kinase [Haliovirga abyssi]|uniref:Diacylglycerol kinase n=1 Tax=Haliovirga abyssi TaxID=2996794 RepID=A0AAU9E233_9FUSO|nr:diacylglycerol kinase [Haliovirga abyssi]BDU50460.1 diacylglycerol kinase [Haliovirga abyssi]
MSSRKIVESFNCAVEGIIEAIRTESHMRFHLYITILVLMFSLFLDLTKLEIGLISIAISFVWITELINTAVEAVVDIYVKEFHELAKVAKDTAAGAVFVAAINSIIIGYLVLYNHFESFSNSILYRLKVSKVHTAVFSIILIVVIVIGLKAYFRKGKPFTGGMPSGHSAVAFSIWVSIIFLSDKIIIILLGLLMALLVSQTRIKSGVHSFKEVIVGAIVGGGVTFLIFVLLRSF